MISGKGHKISMKMRQHYSDEENRRWNRLQGELAWIYLDSYFVLTKWDRVWSAIKENMRKRDEVSTGVFDRSV
jgi:outer membrane phospholipase A